MPTAGQRSAITARSARILTRLAPPLARLVQRESMPLPLGSPFVLGVLLECTRRLPVRHHRQCASTASHILMVPLPECLLATRALRVEKTVIRIPTPATMLKISAAFASHIIPPNTHKSLPYILRSVNPIPSLLRRHNPLTTYLPVPTPPSLPTYFHLTLPTSARKRRPISPTNARLTHRMCCSDPCTFWERLRLSESPCAFDANFE